jgi:hypothetical protein
MSKYPIIRQIVALAMLMVFTFGITPRLYWHDLFANHTHLAPRIDDDGKANVQKSGFQCDCHSLVATSTFTDETDRISIDEIRCYSPFISSFVSFRFSNHLQHTDSRGPPSLG